MPKNTSYFCRPRSMLFSKSVTLKLEEEWSISAYFEPINAGKRL